MIGLTGTNESLELVTAAALAGDYVVTFVDTTATTHTPGSTQGTVSTATTTTMVAAPAASTSRGITFLTFVNRGATAQTISVQKDVGGTNYVILGTTTLGPNESCEYAPASGFTVRDANGRVKTIATTGSAGVSMPASFRKVCTAADTAQYWYCSSKDAGWPGVWAPGTPGVDGRNPDGTAAADRGCIPYINPAAGLSKYLSRIDISSTIANHANIFFDVLWVNSGLDVTATGAQAITSGTLPARDNNGSTNGEGCYIAMLTTEANTNAAVIANSTVAYTNSDGTDSRTATLVAVAGFQIPASPVIGTIVFFQLAGSDVGVRSIQGITLATSLAAGKISLMIVRPLMLYNAGAANLMSTWLPSVLGAPGIRLYNGSCILHCYQAAATTASAFIGQLTFTEQ